MTTSWTITVDCHDARAQAAFWKAALGYVDAPPPTGWATWDAWHEHFRIPPEERDDGATLVDPEGLLPLIGFLRVPEGKVVKNRLHLDLRVSGGRHVDQEERRARIVTMVERLVAAGATVLREDLVDDHLDHVVLADPEGNELCVA